MTAFAPPLADPTAVVGKRIGAWCIDLIIAFFLVSAVIGLLGGSDSERRTFDTLTAAEDYCTAWHETRSGFCLALADGTGSGDDVSSSASTFEHPERILVAVVAVALLYALVQGAMGASTGKRAVGLVVVDVQGRRIGVGRSLARTALWVVDAFTCGVPLLGGILLFATKGHRRVGDMVAGTFVVPKDHVGHPVLVPGLNAPFPGPPGWGAPQGWAPPPQSWAPPATGQSATWAPPGPAEPPAPAAVPTGDGPTWDDARDAYITYDRGREEWLQWHEGAGEWRPIDR